MLAHLTAPCTVLLATFLSGLSGKVKYMMFSGGNALFTDVAKIALAKRPQQAFCVENLSLLIFPRKLSGLTDRNISQRHKRYIGAKPKGLM